LQLFAQRSADLVKLQSRRLQSGWKRISKKHNTIALTAYRQLLSASIGMAMDGAILPFYSHALIHVLIYNYYQGVES